MVKLIEDNYCVDTSHIITAGFSYGGGMSYAIACGRAKVFRAAVIYEGAQLSGCEGGNDPIAYWQMAGITDSTCTMNMATPMRERFVKNNGAQLRTRLNRLNRRPTWATGGISVLNTADARLGIHSDGACTSQVTVPVQSMETRTCTFRVRPLPKRARPRALAPGRQMTFGLG